MALFWSLKPPHSAELEMLGDPEVVKAKYQAHSSIQLIIVFCQSGMVSVAYFQVRVKMLIMLTLRICAS